MKNQYVGDVGDFGKYAMLRVFAEAGVRIGVNWYLTENDGSNDGKYTKYLEDGGLRPLCPEVFDVLKRIAFEPDKTVWDVQQSGLLKDAVYYDELLKKNNVEIKIAIFVMRSFFNAKKGALLIMDHVRSPTK